MMDKKIMSFSSDPVKHIEISSAVVTFNLALTLHLQSMKNGSEMLLKKAKHLYSRSYYIINRTAHSTSQTSSAAVTDDESSRSSRIDLTGNFLIDLFFMALCNNLAQINGALQNFGESKGIFRLLVLFARSVHHKYGTSCPQVSTLMGKHVEFFLLNAVSYRLSPTSGAAAA